MLPQGINITPIIYTEFLMLLGQLRIIIAMVMKAQAIQIIVLSISGHLELTYSKLIYSKMSMANSIPFNNGAIRMGTMF